MLFKYIVVFIFSYKHINLVWHLIRNSLGTSKSNRFIKSNILDSIKFLKIILHTVMNKLCSSNVQFFSKIDDKLIKCYWYNYNF